MKENCGLDRKFIRDITKCEDDDNMAKLMGTIDMGRGIKRSPQAFASNQRPLDRYSSQLSASTHVFDSPTGPNWFNDHGQGGGENDKTFLRRISEECASGTGTSVVESPEAEYQNCQRQTTASDVLSSEKAYSQARSQIS